MNKQLKIIVEKHSDGYVAYPLSLKGVVVSEGDSYEEVLSNIKSAIQFHINIFSDTDIALIEFTDREIAETRELSENIYVDFDESGNIVSMTVEHAKANVGLREFSYQEMPMRAMRLTR